MATRTSWTRDELVLALNLYLRLPFGRMHQSNADVLALASLIGRTPGSVAMRLGNFAALDPALDRRGMANASAGARAIWDEWGTNPDAVAEESERICVNDVSPHSSMRWSGRSRSREYSPRGWSARRW
ncbi:MAG: hypothetical protein Q7K37_08320 [Dehalococcoidia bacterium]|nr:hypothetical protein [Dehalococcoidia bacterium]